MTASSSRSSPNLHARTSNRKFFNRSYSHSPSVYCSEYQRKGENKHNSFSNSADLAAVSDSSSLAPNVASCDFSGYLSIAQMPVFRGRPDECPANHLSRFIKVCRANNVSSTDMMMRIFPVTLEDEAALWYDLNIEPNPSLTWEEIRTHFLDAYQKIEVVDQLRSELMALNQGKEESIRSYFLRMQWILRRWPDDGLSDSFIKGIFLDGLMEDFQDWIMPQKPCSLSEALKLAFCFEQVKSIRDLRKHMVVKCDFCDGPHEEKGCEIRNKMKKFWVENKKRQMGNTEEENPVVGSTNEMAAENDNGDSKKNEDGDQPASCVKKSSSTCRCLKHQCSKRRLEKKLSRLTNVSDADLC